MAGGARVTKAQYRRECQITDVLCDLLAQSVRSSVPQGRPGKKLESDVEAIGRRFASIAKGAITTAAERRFYERNWRMLSKRMNGRAQARR
jgi:hypothetical protein